MCIMEGRALKDGGFSIPAVVQHREHYALDRRCLQAGQIDDMLEHLLKNLGFVHAPKLCLHKETYAQCQHPRQAQL